MGLGYVGLPLAVAFNTHFEVVGFDINQQRIEELRSGIDNTDELSEHELTLLNTLNLTSNAKHLSACNIFIITVPTPINRDTTPNLQPLISASKLVGSVLSKGDLVIYESTVYPGCTDEVCVPILEAESGLTLNKDFHCGYSPERVNPGDKLHRLKDITKIVSGSDQSATSRVEALYRKIIDAGVYVAESVKVAEAAKVIENTQRDLNIALINELSMIFDKMDLETEAVLNAAGTKWNFQTFKPGLVGGHCIGVDPYYLTYKAQDVGLVPQVILAGRAVNDGMGAYVANRLLNLIKLDDLGLEKVCVNILGFSFKENCPDIRNTKVIDVVRYLQDESVSLEVHDPLTSHDEIYETYGLTIKPIEDLPRADAVVIAVAHSNFRLMTPEDMRALLKPGKQLIFDLKSVLNKKLFEDAGFDIVRL